MSGRYTCRLTAPGWNDKARRSLQQLVERGAGQGLPVVFDFDNTIISGDVGEATLAILGAEGRLTPTNVSKSLSPVIQVPGKPKVSLERCSDVMEYYEALLSPTAHGPDDPAPLANGYVWAAQALEGLTVAEVCAATARVFSIGQRGGDLRIDVTPGKTSYPAPRFREEMVELIAHLLRFKYEIWIVSASNVWSVRWMVLYGLNPLLRKYGIRQGLKPKHVIGVTTLLTDELNRLYKDSVLLTQNSAYAAMRRKALKSVRLTRHLQYPASVYSGKVASILDAIDRNPYLCAGDNPSDHPMMRISQYRLWIARLEKPGAQRATTKLIRQMGTAGWIVQTCSETDGPRFLPSLDGALDSRNVDRQLTRSAAILRRLDRQLPVADLPHQPKLEMS
ncbi:MAG TPA: HAD family hydrolase [Candidatus Limnocylindrales bacterium]|nr:HAD family hydrolase [Candidatus Limnocylindrales bacterium]